MKESDSDSNNTSSAEDERNLTPKKRRRFRHEIAKDEIVPRKQLFSNNWMHDPLFIGWLKKVPGDTSKAKCDACSVLLGTKKSDLIKHSKTNKHLQNIKKLKSTPRIETILDTQKHHREKLRVTEAEVRLCLLIANHNFSFKSIEPIVAVNKKSFCDSEIAQKIILKRTKCAKVITNAISENMKAELKLELKNKQISILVDESTDVGNNRLLCMLFRYISENKTKTQLLEIVKVDSDSGKAKGLYALFKISIEYFNIDIKNVVGFSSDNASVMMGVKESFKTYLLKDNPNIICNGCICHSAHLVAADASDELPKNIEVLLQNLHSYFSRSPKRQSILEEFQEFMNKSKNKILSPSKTRWLALSQCVDRVLSQWDVLLEVFRLASFEDKNPLGNIILNEFNNPFVKAYLTFLNYILPVFNEFNSFFQSDKILITHLCVESQRFIKLMCSNFVKEIEYTGENFFTINPINPHILLDIKEINVGPDTMDIISECDECDILQFKLRCLKFYQTTVIQSLKRFPARDRFFENLNFLLPQNALSKNNKCNIDIILNTFSNIDKVTVKNEWLLLNKYFSSNEKQAYLVLSFVEFWNKMLDFQNFNDKNLFKNISKLALAILCIPHGNADVERVFSMMTDIKSKKRNRLLPTTLDSLLRIKLDLKAKNVSCDEYPIPKEMLYRLNSLIYNVKSSNIETDSE